LARGLLQSRAMASPALLLQADIGPSARLRVWKADPERPIAYKPSAHAGVEIAWVTSGSVHYAIGRAPFDVRASGVLVVPQQVEHATTFAGPFSGAAIEVDADTLAELGDALGRRTALKSGPLEDGGASTLGRLLVEELSRREAGALLAADAILEAILIRVLRMKPADTRAPLDPAIARAVKRIEETYADDIGVADLAKEAGMSRFHFSRRFREVTGRSPYRYLCDVRLERAAEMLRRGRHGVTEVALSVGLADPGRFARMFRERFGKSPSQWARASAA
jgi:AraC family transcriptional regulator